MNVRLAIVAIVSAAFVAVPVGVAWADYPPNAPTVQLVANTVPCEANVSVSGSNWQPASTINLTLRGTPVVGSAIANGGGSFSTSFVVPKGTDVGNHQLEANGKAPDGSVAAATTVLNVQNENCANQPVSPSTPGVTVQGQQQSNPNAPGVSNVPTPTGVGAAFQPTTVSGVQQSKPSGILPFTGAAAVGLLLIVGLCFLLTGSTTVLAARRRVR